MYGKVEDKSCKNKNKNKNSTYIGRNRCDQYIFTPSHTQKNHYFTNYGHISGPLMPAKFGGPRLAAVCFVKRKIKRPMRKLNTYVCSRRKNLVDVNSPLNSPISSLSRLLQTRSACGDSMFFLYLAPVKPYPNF